MADTLPSRVVFLIDSLGMGGAESLMVPYLRHLDPARYEPIVCVFSVRDGNPLAHRIRALGIPVDRVPVQRLLDPRGLPRLLRYLRIRRPALLHCQLELAPTLGSVAARLLGIPCVASLHTMDDPPRTARSRWRQAVMWWALRRFCHRVIAVSEAVRSYHVRKGHVTPASVVTLHNGIDVAAFRPEDPRELAVTRSSLGVPPGARIILTVAVLRPSKGIQHLIDALPGILAAVPNAHLLIVGEGAYSGTLRTLAAQRGVTSHVTFAGLRHDVPRLMQLGELFILPSLNDALPTVLMEAMAACKPVVATNVGGIAEIVRDGDTGLLVPPGCPAELGEACVRLLERPECALAMGRRGRQVVASSFEVRQQVALLADLYDGLLGRQPASYCA